MEILVYDVTLIFNGLFSVIYDNDTKPFVLIHLILSSLICPKRCVFSVH